ncbi:BTB/POZ domain-containing protein [Quillaja saponaria]|nr:BTB/POZ domain-containing protein [Quillaja saponaria]
MLQMTKTMDEQTEAINFLKGFIAAFSEQIHTDILVKPGNDGPSIPAHKAILATRSEIFKNMLDSDECKTAPNGTITLPELNHEELKCLIEFLYSGSLTLEKLEKHGYSLLLAADKYEIPYLQKLCERHMHKSLSTSNALDFLEISSICSNKELMERSLSFIVKNFHFIAFLPKYDEFVHKNPHLALQVTREFLKSKGKTN